MATGRIIKVKKNEGNTEGKLSAKTRFLSSQSVVYSN
jgi:hypothetical protein